MNSNFLLNWSQVIATIFIAGTFFIYYLQLRAMKNTSKAQNILSLISFLNSKENHDARKHILSNLALKEFNMWDENDRSEASQVCASYDTAGLLIHNGIVEKAIIIENWGPSILKCHDILAPFIKELRSNMGPRYWDDFDWLDQQIRMMSNNK
jgi:hypothetical protein